MNSPIDAAGRILELRAGVRNKTNDWQEYEHFTMAHVLKIAAAYLKLAGHDGTLIDGALKDP